MDLVYICRDGENEELRYSIRSAVKNLKHKNIWIVGAKPDWYTGNFIPVADVGSKFTNLKNCMDVIASSHKISKEFILMNDDFFIIKPIKRISTVYDGYLIDKLNQYRELTPVSQYTTLMNNAYKFLVRYGIDNPINYDLHVPMKMNRDLLLAIQKYPGLSRTVYGNLYGIGGKQFNDVKVYTSTLSLISRSYDFKDKDITYISTEDESFDVVYENVLKDLFPDPSKYESNPYAESNCG